MTAYVLRRLLSIVPVLVGVSLITFMSIHLTPGDPVDQILADNANREAAEALREYLRLNDPLPVQYGRWLGAAIQGDFGRSLLTNQPVLDEILSRLPNTVRLALAGMFVSFVIGVPLGVLAAISKRSWVDSSIMLFALVGLSMPSFWLGLLLILLFAVNLGWFPALGDSGLKSLFLPAVALGVAYAAIIARLTRSSMLEIMRNEYMQTARAKGLRERHVITHHALKNAAIPVLTVVGIQFGNLLAGTVIIESVFARSGLGSLAIRAIQARDFPVIQAIVLFYAVFYILSSLTVDLLYGVLDPRVRFG